MYWGVVGWLRGCDVLGENGLGEGWQRVTGGTVWIVLASVFQRGTTSRQQTPPDSQ
jgi:hypothetical protein